MRQCLGLVREGWSVLDTLHRKPSIAGRLKRAASPFEPRGD